MNRLSTHFQPWDIQLVTTMYEALARRHPKRRTRGRRGAPAEMVLRLLVLKHVRIGSYATLEREVRSNLMHRVHADRRRSGPRSENHGPVGRRLLLSAAWSRRSSPPRRSGSA